MSRSALSELMDLDRVKQHWPSYGVVAVAAVCVHVAWAMKFGINPSTDFAVRYDPGARDLLGSLGVSGFARDTAFSIGSVGWLRIGYISFIALCYRLFGASLASVVYPQIALVWLVYPLAFHILHHITRRLTLSLGAICVWMTFYDTYQWHFWAVPDSLFRLIFLLSFFILLRLWETRREMAFVCTTLAAIAIATVFRIETPLYALPALWVCAGIVHRRSPALLWAGVACAAALVWVGSDFLREIFKTFVYLQARGFILPGSGMDIPGFTQIDHPLDHSRVSWALYFLHLFSARFWYAITPFPALWSRAHRMYYAFYMVPAYVLALGALIPAVRRRDAVFLVCAWVFAAGILLQVLVAVDPSMRYAYTPHVFLFFCAAMGWLEAWQMLAGRRDRGPRRVEARA